jgi:hypothetical protein
MKRNLIKDILSLQPSSKRLKTSQREHDEFFLRPALQEIPTEMIYKIVEYCGIIEKHVLRFVCKKFYKISHKCGSIQESSFFFRLLW